ncbi:hypothetical protein DPMN_131695 [Dreissena polymorpha]|uniref:Uncharacterized protein n=1 Tax=Dreissena polymorpha TaxID=45954 RepID=A0A9D4JBF0_DREPO|nr:hypothetical protein DPMN_131695 [Dreissena polymorpha]
MAELDQLTVRERYISVSVTEAALMTMIVNGRAENLVGVGMMSRVRRVEYPVRTIVI